jgi:hypothetical protein
MTKALGKEGSFVKQQVDKLLAILHEEHKLKVELLHLDLGPQAAESMKKNSAREWEILGKLRSINMDQKLPIVRELANFIKERMPSAGHGAGTHASSQEELKKHVRELEHELHQVDHQIQQADAHLQQELKKQQARLQKMSDISKVLYDTATAATRPAGG